MHDAVFVSYDFGINWEDSGPSELMEPKSMVRSRDALFVGGKDGLYRRVDGATE